MTVFVGPVRFQPVHARLELLQQNAGLHRALDAVIAVARLWKQNRVGAKTGGMVSVLGDTHKRRTHNHNSDIGNNTMTKEGQR